MAIDPDTLEAAALRARRATTVRAEQLDACLRIATRYPNGVAAWEALSANGFVPEAWLSESHRWFGLPKQFYRRKRALIDVDPSLLEKVSLGAGFTTRAARAPIEVRWAALLAAMARSLIEAESLARECRRRLSAWSDRAVVIEGGAKVVWLARRYQTQRDPIASIEMFERSLWVLRASLAQSPSAPTMPAPMREELAASLDGDYASLVALVNRLQAAPRRTPNAAVAAGLFSSEANSRFVRALERVAGEEPTPFGPSRYYPSYVLPARARIKDPFEPWIAIADLGVRWIAETPEGIALTTPTPDDVGLKK
jgi:hypothetical protein